MKKIIRPVGLCLILLFAAEMAAFAQSRPDALAEYRAGNYELALQICQNEINENPANIESHVVMCWTLIRLNRYNDALRFARAARELNRYDARVTEILGEVHYYQGRNAEALRFFEEYVNLNPEGQRIEMVYFFIGEIFIRQGKFRHADIALSTAVHWMPGNAAWWTRLAYARENSGDLEEAVTAYERSLSLDPQQSDARRGLDRVRQTLAGR